MRLSLSCDDVMIMNQDRRYSFFASGVDSKQDTWLHTRNEPYYHCHQHISRSYSAYLYRDINVNKLLVSKVNDSFD